MWIPMCIPLLMIVWATSHSHTCNMHACYMCTHVHSCVRMYVHACTCVRMNRLSLYAFTHARAHMQFQSISFYAHSHVFNLQLKISPDDQKKFGHLCDEIVDSSEETIIASIRYHMHACMHMFRFMSRYVSRYICMYTHTHTYIYICIMLATI